MSEVLWASHADCGAVADHLAGVITRPASPARGSRRLTPIPILRCLGRRDSGGAGGD
jgi:hypothetical protein